MGADGSSVERRKSRRFPVVVPLQVSWRGVDDVTVKEDAVARQVNANGGFLKMSNYPDLGSRVTLANFISAQTSEARVIAAPHAREGVASGIIVELIVPSESFWGVDLQVKKTLVELQNLEKALQSEDMDLRLVKEYRDAVDYIRAAAGTLEQLREYQFRGMDDAELLSDLAADRILRTTNLCLGVVADLDAGRVKNKLQDVDELLRAVVSLQERLKGLAKRSTRNATQAASSAAVPKFDIFAGAPDKSAVWVCGVAGLANARETMEQIAAERPGRYFIFHAADHNVLSQIETFPSDAKKPERESA